MDFSGEPITAKDKKWAVISVLFFFLGLCVGSGWVLLQIQGAV